MLLTAAPASAQEGTFPSQTVEIVVGRSAGGGMDLHARGLAPFLQKHLPGDESVIVTNRPGAGGVIALTSIWDAEPDGHQITMTITSSDIINSIVNDDVAWKLSEFDFLGSLYAADTGLLVRSDLGWETIDDMREAAGDEPIVFGTTGVGSTAHIEGLFLYDQHLGIPVRFVHYPGTSDVMLAVARGEVHATSFGVNTAANFAEGDESLDMLLAWSEEPVEFFEDVPTALEAGVTQEEFDTAPPVMGQWRGLMTTPGTPEPVLEILRQAFADAMNDPEYDEWRLQANLPKRALIGEEFTELVERIEAGYEAIGDELKELIQ
ncbi:Bug family tripartite tricarboxylate transporter substrate binding protein [Cucumibacter marinus]|uniref:Bug family tripartite tricarboxylate transporter substrate binding protein n=1 Tax=Cucumibacter marinus TaxID=1121252 RepID=UPI00048BA804|nr:tripartite tricarboxylate transporter substrate binding protein [Cucumibacter marinus]